MPPVRATDRLSISRAEFQTLHQIAWLASSAVKHGDWFKNHMHEQLPALVRQLEEVEK